MAPRIVQPIPSFDLYRELEVDPAASTETIDAAWKSLLKRLHPDVVGDAAAADRVKRLNLAHEWLADPEKRALYDRGRRRDPFVIPRGAAVRRPTAASADDLPRSDHTYNPYAEYDAPRPRWRPAPATPAPPPPRPAGSPEADHRPRYAMVLAPLAFASVVIVVVVSSFIGSSRFPTAAAEASATPAVAASAGPVSTQLGALASTAANPRGLPPPNLAAAIPADCHNPDFGDAVTFETRVRSAPAQVAVVPCDGGQSVGPVVYVAGTDRWDQLASVGLHSGTPLQGFSGSITGTTADEFGIAWRRDGGVRATVTLYRLTATVEAFWDSADIGLQWTLPTFTYRPAADASVPGSLVVVEADLTTGTADCASCRDHQLYREFYEWRTVTGRGQLVRTSREPFGIGPS